jgi:hypothetical protein
MIAESQTLLHVEAVSEIQQSPVSPINRRRTEMNREFYYTLGHMISAKIFSSENNTFVSIEKDDGEEELLQPKKQASFVSQPDNYGSQGLTLNKAQWDEFY